MFLAAVFVMTKNEKPSKCPLAREGVSDVNTRITEHSTAVQQSESICNSAFQRVLAAVTRA